LPREGLDQQLVEIVAFAGLLPDRFGARAKRLAVELFELRFEGVDGVRDGKMALDLSLVRIEQPGKDDHWPELEVTRPGRI